MENLTNQGTKSKIAVFFSEFCSLFVLDGFYIVIHEGFAGVVKHLCLGIVLEYIVGYRMHEVGLSKSDASIEIKYLVYISGAFRYCH